MGFVGDRSTALSTGGVLSRREFRGGVLERSLPPSNMAASDAVLSGRAVALVELELLRLYSGRSARSRAGERSCGPGDSGSLDGERISLDGDAKSLEGERRCAGELGRSPAPVVAPVLSHGGASRDELLVRSGAGDEAPGVSFGFSGELLGVEGRAVDGEPCLMELGRPKGDWREPRALLKKSGDGLESVGADCGMLVSLALPWSE